MRTSILIALLPFLAGGCILLDNDLNSGPPRAGTFFRDHGDDEAQEGGDEAVRQADTSIYFCAVRFDDDYVWQRDTAYGSVPYELLLFKDSEQILSIKSSASSCISPDHDTHHIIDGHLYTEYSNLSRTTIGRDGIVILDFSGREFLKGLMPHDGDIYTLTERRDGSGFSFRKNGEILFTKSGGSLFGGMDDPSYGPTGALYFDRGDLTFCYWTGKGALRKYFRVRNGTEEEEITKFSGKAVTDIKPQNGYLLAAGTELKNCTPVSCSLWILPADIVTAGVMKSGSRSFSGIYYRGEGRLQEICEGDATVYCSDCGWSAVSAKGADVGIRSSTGASRTEADSYFLSPSCAVLIGDRFIYSVSPRAEDGFPKLWDGEKYVEVPVHGYVSRVAVEISPAS